MTDESQPAKTGAASLDDAWLMLTPEMDIASDLLILLQAYEDENKGATIDLNELNTAILSALMRLDIKIETLRAELKAAGAKL